jgi:hypothetical protein
MPQDPSQGYQPQGLQLPELSDDQLGQLFQYQQLQGKQAAALRNQQMATALRGNANKAADHRTGWGAAAAGLGDVLDSYRAGKMGRAAQADLADVQAQAPAARAGAYNLARLFQFGNGRGPTPASGTGGEF